MGGAAALGRRLSQRLRVRPDELVRMTAIYLHPGVNQPKAVLLPVTGLLPNPLSSSPNPQANSAETLSQQSAERWPEAPQSLPGSDILRSLRQPCPVFTGVTAVLLSPAPAPAAALGLNARELSLSASARIASSPSSSSSSSSCYSSSSVLALGSALALGTGAASFTASAKAPPLEHNAPQEVVLYQYEACPFCNKVKAYLDYHNIPYRVVEVNPLTRKEIKQFEYKKVPVLVVDGEPLKDSSVIISTLEERFYPAPEGGGKVSGLEEEQKEEEAKWRKWVDAHLVHLLSPNIYRTATEALEAFDYITTNGNFTALERTATRYFGAGTMYFIGKKLKKKHNIDNERESLYSALREWTAAVGSKKFLGGSNPNLADLAVFGVLRPIRNMQTGREMMEHTDVGRWYNDMVAEVGESSRLPEQA